MIELSVLINLSNPCRYIAFIMGYEAVKNLTYCPFNAVTRQSLAVTG